MQMDFYCTPAKLFTRHFQNIKMDNAELQNYVDLLLKWNGILSPDLIESSLYKVSKKMIVERLFEAGINDKQLIDELMGKGSHGVLDPVNSYLGHNTPILLRILDNPSSFWLQKAGGKEKLLKDGFKAAIDWLKLNYGTNNKKWNWGNLHAIVFPHSFSVKPPMDKVFDIGPYLPW